MALLAIRKWHKVCDGLTSARGIGISRPATLESLSFSLFLAFLAVCCLRAILGQPAASTRPSGARRKGPRAQKLSTATLYTAKHDVCPARLVSSEHFL